MKKTSVVLETTKVVDENNVVQPNEYRVYKDNQLIVFTDDFAYALQAYINRVND